MKIIERIKIYLKKIKRAKRIKKLKSKIAPYLKKDFGVELNYKLWTTKGARFLASERNNILNDLSSKTVGYLSAYLIIINLINVYELPYLIELSNKQLGFTTTALSILILIYSQFESAKNHSIKSEKFHQCGLEIAELYSELRMIKTFKNINNPENKIRDISDRYDIILKKYENHKPIDFKSFTTTKPSYFKLNMIDVLWIKTKKYLIIKLKYHLMIYGPILIFVGFQIYKNTLANNS